MSVDDTGVASAPRGLAKLRKGLAGASTNSLDQSLGDDDSTSGKVAEGDDGGLRASVESAIDKVKERTRRRSVDVRGNNEHPPGRRLSTFLSKTKRKVKGGDRTDELERNRSIDSETGQLPGSRSNASLLLDDSGRSSILTYDERSDSEGQPVRPILSPRDSHAGYLTLSSPEINAHTNPLVDGADLVSSPDETVPPNESLPSIPYIVEPDGADDLAATTASDRNSSPINKLRGPFTLSRKKSSGDDSVRSAGGGSGSGGLAGLFKSSSRASRANSVSSAPASEPQKTETILEAAVAREQVQVGQGQGQNRPETPKLRGRLPPRTSLSLPATPPNLIEPPTTLVTPPTPTDSNANAPTFPRPVQPLDRSPARSPSSVESIRHRRAQSATLPSKLSTSVAAPLTPTVEETKTPGGTLTQPAPNSPSAGFFSSVFSVAQKAGAQFSLLPTQKVRAAPAPTTEPVEGEEVIPGVESRSAPDLDDGESKQLAVETLGRGNLSLSHLGIPDSQENTPMNSTTELPQGDAQTTGDDRSRKAEEAAAARAVSSAYEKPLSTVASQITSRPLSAGSNDRLTLNGDQTPPRHAVDPAPGGIKRSGSVRSKLSGRRKHRGSSATAGTGNSIAAALKDSTVGLANPGLHGQGHRLTGFAVASSKRNKDFHQLFRSVPEDDYLIEDYSAALQRDILLHGRLYISEGHICFSSNILGWVTNLVVSFDEVVSVEKKSTAVIFPNAIVISTLHARNTFASLVARDSTYELLIGIWKISHPNLKSSLNGVRLDDAGTGDKTEVVEPEGSENESEGTEDEVYDEDADDDVGSFTDGDFVASAAGSDVGDTTLNGKASTLPLSSAPQANSTDPKGLEASDGVVTAAAMSSEFPGTPTHEPTQCTDTAEHYDRPLTDTTIPAPLGKVYSLMFGPASGAFMKKWLVEDQKSGNLNYADDKTGLDNDHTTFTFDYIKPLSAPVGPRQTKCITTNTLKAFDLEKAVSVDCSTQTPDVPSGNVFTTKTRYCLMWGPANTTRMIASCTIEWTGKSWLKGPIEKGAEQGQTDYVKAIVAALKAAVTTKPPVKGMARKGRRKGKKEVFDAEEANMQREAAIVAEQKKPAWGPLELLRQILEPLNALIGPLVNSQLVIAVLLVLLLYSWFAKPRTATNVGYPGYTSPERIAAYEEIWRREESALWDWLDDRVGVSAPQLQDRQKYLHSRHMDPKLDARMSDRQMDEQIRTTEEKLAALKEAIERKKARG